MDEFSLFFIHKMQNPNIVFVAEPFSKGGIFSRDSFGYGADWDRDHPNDFQKPLPGVKTGTSHQQGKDGRISEKALGKRTDGVRAIISPEFVFLPVKSESDETSLE
nr:hypothetical protein MarFTME_413 [Marseillevirus futianmevirus]